MGCYLSFVSFWFANKLNNMVRAPAAACCEEMGLKKGTWTPEEDHILTTYIQHHGHGNWRALPKLAGISLYIYIQTRMRFD